ncbi:glutathione S-transferase 1-1 [Onthophagus taurus]|uniref:glutathione S-transferase 1-1 n=1 Tax=Onthophagus taurus TaxID=166361 RepID=UPI000C20C942|nr:glutathione S-transferase 1-1 [Onthophagus taurus]
MVIKLYSVSDGPPSLAVRQCLKAINLDYTLINVDFGAGDHMTEEYAKLNPQKEIPVLDDDGFLLSESNAILQYLVEKYYDGNDLYPKDPKSRAIVNHRLCFNMAFYYSSISAYVMAPIFFDYQRTPLSLKKLHIALDVFNTYLKTLGAKYSASDNLTIADFPLCTATMCLEAINFDFSKYSYVSKWYETFKRENPDLWKIAEEGMKEIAEFEKNPPDLSHMDHPIHPIRKVK